MWFCSKFFFVNSPFKKEKNIAKIFMWKFSIKKFFSYLLSFNFLENFMKLIWLPKLQIPSMINSLRIFLNKIRINQPHSHSQIFKWNKLFLNIELFSNWEFPLNSLDSSSNFLSHLYSYSTLIKHKEFKKFQIASPVWTFKKFLFQLLQKNFPHPSSWPKSFPSHF